MSQFYVSHEGQQLGPMGQQEIVEAVRKNTLSVMDYIYDEQKSDWVLLMEYPPLAKQLKDFSKAPPPKLGPPISGKDPGPQSGTEHEITEWYVLKGENKFGPFVIADVIKMLQQKVVFEFDFVWHPGLNSWKRIAELDPFRPENVRKLQSSKNSEAQEVFFRRRHRRLSYNGTILVHDNKTVWKGQGLEISAGGAGVVMENAMIVPGQTLYLHFKPGDGVPPFNAVCEVVSKQFVDGVREKNAAIRYGLKFSSIHANTQQFLHEMARKSDAA